ncbi:hypothetical protein J7384_17810 [Endozoicomonas sp. G2_1]|uniref:hypothetical protein n=1 Tax=Endozoicomonas sp. G2_1 TaxID=2821091 RepID=UPI001ADBA957|nr:hypothetical protein [Endozoicomonas sp. G2_1]MBO9492222.1 hypothetical protein [Endozoicomonas sp. G2_1]
MKRLIFFVLVKSEALFWLFVFLVLALVMSLLSVVINLVALLCALFGKGKVKRWGINCFEGLDNYRSAQTGGDPDDTLSSRLGKARKRGSKWTFIANKVDLVAIEIFKDANHCEKSIERDEGKKQVTRY